MLSLPYNNIDLFSAMGSTPPPPTFFLFDLEGILDGLFRVLPVYVLGDPVKSSELNTVTVPKFFICRATFRKGNDRAGRTAPSGNRRAAPRLVDLTRFWLAWSPFDVFAQDNRFRYFFHRLALLAAMPLQRNISLM